jgi:ribosomal protein S27AE
MIDLIVSMAKDKKINITLEGKHKQILKKFDQKKKELPKKEKQLKTVKKELERLNKKPDPKDDETLDKIYFLEKRLNTLIDEIADIKTGSEMEDYYKNTGDILFKYYDSYNLENISESLSISSSTSEEDISNNVNNILNYIDQTTFNKTNCINMHRKKLLNKYMKHVDDSYIDDKLNKKIKYKKCKECGNEMILNQIESLLECKNCGISEFIYIDCEKPSYKDPPPEQSNYAYKKINHFKEWLVYAQAKESTDIPTEIITDIYKEIKKERIKNLASLTKNKIKDYLKELGYDKYYEHSPLILMKIKGIPPIRLSASLEKRLVDMFTEVLPIYSIVKPNNRRNFFSYSYILYKFLELLEYDDEKKYFNLFKGTDNLKKQDVLFKKICNILKWEFIPSS